MLVKYGNRKNVGFLSVIYDCNVNAFLPVPGDMEHVELVQKVFSATKKELSEMDIDISFLVPISFEIDPMTFEIKEIIIGIFGLEIGFKVKHTHGQFEAAHQAVLKAVQDACKSGEYFISSSLKLTVNKKYIKM